MITITINTDTAYDARAQLRELLGQDAETAQPSNGPAPRPARATKAKPSPEADPVAEPVAEAPVVQEETAPAAPAPTVTGEVDKADLTKRLTRFGTKNPDGLKQLLISHGSTDGKWSQVPVESYPALSIQIDELLAGAAE